VKEIAAQITRDYAGKTPILIGILKGAFIFLADLTRNIELPLKVDFVRLASFFIKTFGQNETCFFKGLCPDRQARTERSGGKTGLCWFSGKWLFGRLWVGL